MGQITCLDSEDMLQRREEFLEAMRHDQEDHHYDMVILMLTDVLMEGTQLLYVGSDDVIRNAFSAEPKDNSLFLPKVMSREKADHPHAHRPLGLISPHFTQGQAPACPCFSLHIVLY